MQRQMEFMETISKLKNYLKNLQITKVKTKKQLILNLLNLYITS